MNTTIERTGVAEVLFGDDVLAIGTYQLVLVREPPPDREGSRGAATARARGSVRFAPGQSPPAVLPRPAVRLRLDERAEILVEVELYVPTAAFLVFTCPDAGVLTRGSANEPASSPSAPSSFSEGTA